MGKNAEYEILFNKYNLAVAQAKDLQEQLSTKQTQWQQRNTDFSIIEKNVRELCEGILAKDSSEMVLGTDYSWATISVNELIIKAKRVFKEYNAKRTDIMSKLMDMAEDRREQIESLKEEIIQLKTRSSISSDISREEIEEQVQKDLKKKEDKKAVMTASKTMSPAIQHAIQNNEIDVETVKNSLVSGEAFITGEDSDLDFDDDEIEIGTVVHSKDGLRTKLKSKETILRADALRMNNMTQITSNSIPMTESQKAVKNRKELKERLNTEHSVVMLSEYEAKISDCGWILLDIIGKYGLSKISDIINKALEVSANNIKMTKPKFISNIADLNNIGVITKEVVITPYTKMYVYRLTSEGARIYKAKYGRSACLSEADKIIAEHDNLVHGYSIKAISEILEKSGVYKDVEIWNRKKNAITISGGITYIPDIVCTGENGEHTYIEFERDKWSQKNFNVKLNKMLAVTPTLSFIVGNKEIAESIIKKMVKWAKTKGNGGNMRHVICRVTTAKAIKGIDLSDNNNWMYTFKPSKDADYISNF